ncbi:MAG: glycosyltransferase [Pseudomonadota bacterium]|nr:glycosyltransferase [Pseudomonadota bacterium]
MTERRVSVVICTDDRLPYLKSTLQALEGLDYRAFELCLVCGPTPDGTREFAAALGARVKIAHCPKRNLSRARNLGVALAAGEIVAFLDDDAMPEAEWLTDLSAAYDDPETAAAGGVVYDPTGLEFQARFVTIDRLGYATEHWRGPLERLSFPFSPEFPHLLGANCSARRETLLELGGFDEEYEYFLDETDLLTRINDAGGRIAQLPRAAVHHRPAPSVLRESTAIMRSWRQGLKNRVYFGLRNALRHHTPWEVLRAAVNDAEQWQAGIERRVAMGEQPRADLARFTQEGLLAVAEGIEAARAPARKLMSAAARRAEPPALRPYPLPKPARRLCLALVTQDYPPGQNGGIARNMAELASAWAAMGHFVHVFTRAKGRPSLDFEAGVWVHRLEPAASAAPPDLIPPHQIPQSLWDHSQAMFEAVAKLDATRRVDLVYAPLWDCEPMAFLREPRFPLLCALQTTMDFWLDSQPARRADPEWMRARGDPLLALERWTLERAPLLHANSRAIVEDIASRYALALSAERIVFAPHGVSDWARDAAARPDGDGVRFLFVGRLESRKGIDVVLAAAPEVLRRFPQARLDIVGDDRIERAEGGTYRAAFLARDDVADVADRIVFHGRVEEAALRAHYRDCDVLVAPSRYESFGLIYVEGMIFGKPVIGGRAGGGAEVIEHGVGGLLVPPGDAAALAAAMASLAADPVLRAAMGEAGRRRYETHFRAEAAGTSLLDGALALLSEKPR